MDYLSFSCEKYPQLDPTRQSLQINAVFLKSQRGEWKDYYEVPVISFFSGTCSVGDDDHSLINSLKGKVVPQGRFVFLTFSKAAIGKPAFAGTISVRAYGGDSNERTVTLERLRTMQLPLLTLVTLASTHHMPRHSSVPPDTSVFSVAHVDQHWPPPFPLMGLPDHDFDPLEALDPRPLRRLSGGLLNPSQSEQPNPFPLPKDPSISEGKEKELADEDEGASNSLELD